MPVLVPVQHARQSQEPSQQEGAKGFVKMGDDGAEGSEDIKCCFGGVLTPNSKVLLVSMAFFSVITTAQVFAAIAANSAALMADCVSMGIDAASYGCNVISEAWPNPDKRIQERNQLVTSGISFGLLIFFTFQFMLEALDTITSHMSGDGGDDSCCDPGGDDRPEAEACHIANSQCDRIAGNFTEDFTTNENMCEAAVSDDGSACDWQGVNPYIVFVFALFGLLFDLGSLLAFRHWGQSFAVLVGGEDSEALNMSSALMHVLSDCLRSTTTLIESILIFLNPDTPSYIFDGWATLIVTLSILFTAFSAVYKWARQLQAWVDAGKANGIGQAITGQEFTTQQAPGYEPPV